MRLLMGFQTSLRFIVAVFNGCNPSVSSGSRREYRQCFTRRRTPHACRNHPDTWILRYSRDRVWAGFHQKLTAMLASTLVT
jgi:hypothetical protein